MKHTILSLFFFISSISFLLAQDFNGGVLAGLATSEVSGDRLQGPHKAGLYLGAYVNRYISQESSIQMELNYVQKGSRENPDSTNNFNLYRLRLNYVELPVHYRYDLNERFKVELGLALGVLVHSDEEGYGGEVIAGEEFYRTDLSGNVGLYYGLIENVWVNIRYSNSILPVRPHASGATWGFNKGQYNEVLSFVLFFNL